MMNGDDDDDYLCAANLLTVNHGLSIHSLIYFSLQVTQVLEQNWNGPQKCPTKIVGVWHYNHILYSVLL